MDLIGKQPLQQKPEQKWQLIGMQAAILGLLFQELTIYLLAIMLLCLLWQLTVALKSTLAPTMWLVQTVALVCCVLLMVMGVQLGLLLAMIHLMCFSYVLKNLQLKSLKDFYLVILQGYFLLAAILIFHQDFIVVFAVLMLFVLNTGLLAQGLYKNANFKKGFALSGKLLLLSLPLTVGLFVLFPKLAPFWQVPLAKSAKTGLSDIVKPGDIANLVQSDELVFRAVFNQTPPSYRNFYWRAHVLDEYDGAQWQKSAALKRVDQYYLRSSFAEPLSPIKPTMTYQVIVEPSFKPWLYHLGESESTTKDVVRLPAARLAKTEPVVQTFSYNVASDLGPSGDSGQLSPFWQQRLTSIPIDSNPQLFSYGRALAASFDNADEIARNLASYITENEFFYTLQPPPLINNSLDEFFFKNRAGFCEHYASSAAFIMRAAGVPSRLVTGYMGAELNPQTGHYAVYQYDAHAWMEYWSNSAGWVRFDPTAYVSPERVEQGLNQALSNEDSAFLGGALSLSQYRSNALLNYLRLKLDALDYQWTKWVLNYSVDAQNDLLKSLLGKGYVWKNSLLISGALIITLFIAWFYLRQSQKQKEKPQIKLLLSILYVAQKKGFTFAKQDTVNELCMKLSYRFPSLKNSFEKLALLLDEIEYQVIDSDAKTIKISELQKEATMLRKRIQQL